MTELPQATTTRPLLLVDDDATFVRVLARALVSRGFEVITASNFDEARALARRQHPRYCVLDLKLGEESGLRLIPELHTLVPDLRVLLLTGYASIATAVEAIKRGAHDYLAKPVDADAVVRALLDGDSSDPDVSVPIAPAANPAATATAEPALEPPGCTIGTPLSSTATAYGFSTWPPNEL